MSSPQFRGLAALFLLFPLALAGCAGDGKDKDFDPDDPANFLKCRIDGKTYDNSDKNPANPCEVCDYSKSKTGWSTQWDGATCNDAGTAFCRSGACQVECQGGLQVGESPYPCQVCDASGSVVPTPGAECEGGICNQSGSCGNYCEIDGSFLSSNDRKSEAESCSLCLPDVSRTEWSTAPDGYGCGPANTCISGICEEACYIDGVRYEDGEENPESVCQYCGANRIQWTNLPQNTACGDGKYCRSGSCVDWQFDFDDNNSWIGTATALVASSRNDIYVGGASRIMRSNDGGASFADVTVPEGLSTLRTLWMAPTGAVIGAANGALYKSSGEGEAFGELAELTGLVPMGVWGPSEDEFTVVGWDGVILHTTNGGTTMLPQTSGTSKMLRAVHGSGDVAYAVGSEGTVLRGVGGTWTALDADTAVDLFAVFATSEDEVWVVGDHGTVLHSTDGGEEWESVSTGATGAVRAIHIAGNHIYVGTQQYGIFYSPDAGATWKTARAVTASASPTAYISGLWADESGYVIAIRDDGRVYRAN